MGKNISILAFITGILTFSLSAHGKTPWVYFDLGETVIKTKDSKKLRYFPGAKEYLANLKAQGFKVGIISNIPENWGIDYEEKLRTLKKFIGDGWSESTPFDWSVFSEILLPLHDQDMKPAPELFLKAIDKADGCPSLFIGEAPREVEAAKGLGMAAKLFDEAATDLYLPLNEINKYIENNYHRDYDPECLLPTPKAYLGLSQNSL